MNVETLKEIKSLLDLGVSNVSETGRRVAETLGVDCTDSYRRTIANYVKKIQEHPALAQETIDKGLDFSSIRSYWHKSKQFSIRSDVKESFNYDDFREDFCNMVEGLAPKHSKVVRDKIVDGHCLLIDPADIHINKLASAYETGVEYNSQIAVMRVFQGVDATLDKSRGYNIDKIILVVGNDVLNTDTIKGTTTKGTEQDTHLKWFDAFRMAKQMYVDIIDKLIQVADVEVIYNVSNHDHMSGFFLADSLASWYRQHPNVEFKNSPSHRKYTTYGKNLIGTTHGDGAKQTDLPLLMAHEASEYWHDCKHRYIFGHHVHHKVSKDYMSVQFETLRSPSPADSWHHTKGYQHSPLCIEGFLFHKEFGQVARFTTIF